jgi:hypothetical protein
MKKIWTEIRYFFLKIRMVLRWVPATWEDRDWEGSNVLYILIQKLRFQRDSLVKNDQAGNIDRINAEMTECIELLEKVCNEWEFYEQPALDAHYLKWTNNTHRYLPVDENGKYLKYSEIFSHLSEAERVIERNEFAAARKLAENQRQKDMKRAFKIISERVDYWWD